MRIEHQQRRARREEGGLTSVEVIRKAAQSILGRIFSKSFGFGSIVSLTSSQSFGCSGNDVVLDLHALTAHVRKLRVRIFIVAVKGLLECMRSKLFEGKMKLLREECGVR